MPLIYCLLNYYQDKVLKMIQPFQRRYSSVIICTGVDTIEIQVECDGIILISYVNSPAICPNFITKL